MRNQKPSMNQLPLPGCSCLDVRIALLLSYWLALDEQNLEQALQETGDKARTLALEQMHWEDTLQVHSTQSQGHVSCRDTFHVGIVTRQWHRFQHEKTNNQPENVPGYKINPSHNSQHFSKHGASAGLKLHPLVCADGRKRGHGAYAQGYDEQE
jgi:hypothetical protein